jgi:hypothetical protein
MTRSIDHVSTARKPRLSPFYLVLCAFLGACAGSSGAPVLRNVELMPLYSPQFVHWAAMGRDLPLLLFVNAPPDTLDAWKSAAGQALSDLPGSPVGRVTAWPDGSQRGNVQMVVVVDAPVGMTASAACSGAVDEAGLVSSTSQSHVLLAFCNDNRVVSTARAVVPALSGPSSHQFAAALQAAATQALPRNDPDRAKGSEPFLVP